MLGGQRQILAVPGHQRGGDGQLLTKVRELRLAFSAPAPQIAEVAVCVAEEAQPLQVAGGAGHQRVERVAVAQKPRLGGAQLAAQHEQVAELGLHVRQLELQRLVAGRLRQERLHQAGGRGQGAAGLVEIAQLAAERAQVAVGVGELEEPGAVLRIAGHQLTRDLQVGAKLLERRW